MARIIQSPGVQFSEVDLSLKPSLVSPTDVLITGFADKGPVADPILVSSISEYEQIFGLPTTAAERYLYHTTTAVFNSPANVTVYRLPYGPDKGIGYTNNYSALAYPVTTVVQGGAADVISSTLSYSTSAATLSGVTYFFGEPTHISLTESQYLGILNGTAFTWSSAGGVATFSSLSSLANAGLIVLNKAQTSINQRFEGTYIGIIDNTALNPATNFDNFSATYSVSDNTTYVNTSNFTVVPQQRLTFSLSATKTGVSGSVSEVIENIATFDTSTSQYNDTINIGVFKLRQSVFSPDVIQLDYIYQEGYNASFDYYRQINNVRGGAPISYFLQNVEDSSKNIVTLVNPYISNAYTSTWLNNNGFPTKGVRFLSNPRGNPLSTDNDGTLPLSAFNQGTFYTRTGCTSATYASLLATYGSNDKLFALGDFSNQQLNTKVIGDVPGKLDKMFSTIENSDIYPLSIVPEAGLGTIYVNSLTTATTGYFDDSIPYYDSYGGIGQLSASPVSKPGQANVLSLPLLTNYKAVADKFVTFASQTRKDHIFIADAITNIFAEGYNGVKTLDNPNNNFSDNIYWPLRNQFSFVNNSYTAAYANVAKVADASSSRQIWVPFSGFATAIMANTDANYQPWTAPAGFTRGIVTGVTDLGFYPVQKQRDQLYKIGLNPVAFFPNEGYVVYGQKTLQKQPTAFDRINVRRLFLTLERQTNTVVKNFVFEPNTLFTRTQVKNVLAPIFDNAKNTQGIYDYLLICDERNNTPTVIDDNSLVVDVYIKPVRTAEFILVNFYATRTNQNFAEIVA